MVDWQSGLLTLSNHFLYFWAVGHLRTIILRENTEACLVGATALPWRTVWLWGCTSESWWRSLNKNPLLLWNIHFLPDHFQLIEWKLKHPAHHAKAFRKMNVTNGSLKKPESRGTLIILALIIFSLFQIQSLQIDKTHGSVCSKYRWTEGQKEDGPLPFPPEALTCTSPKRGSNWSGCWLSGKFHSFILTVFLSQSFSAS